MTQIKGTFEGCGEAPAPLKLNEVFISHADSTLNTARSRAVTVNVSLRSICCLFSLANGPEEKKNHQRTVFFMLFFHAWLLPTPSISHTWSSLVFFLQFLTFVPSHHCCRRRRLNASPLSSPSCLSSRRKPVYCGFLLDLRKATQLG